MPRVDDLYFNDNDKGAVRWLNNAFPHAIVDPRSITNVKGSQLNAYDRVHLFAGIGGWQLALDLAGWPRGRPVWTGSCPCQPFSAAGKGAAFADARHLWPEMCRLVGECRPPTIFGEQVASKAGREWLARVRADLEALGYAVGAADLPACSVGAPQKRSRLWWVARTTEKGRCRRFYHDGRRVHDETTSKKERQSETRRITHAPGSSSADGFWSVFNVVQCTDGKSRRIEPRIEPVAHGVPDWMVKVRGYGNAIVPQLAALFVRCFLETEGECHAEG